MQIIEKLKDFLLGELLKPLDLSKNSLNVELAHALELESLPPIKRTADNQFPIFFETSTQHYERFATLRTPQEKREDMIDTAYFLVDAQSNGIKLDLEETIKKYQQAPNITKDEVNALIEGIKLAQKEYAEWNGQQPCPEEKRTVSSLTRARIQIEREEDYL